MALVKKSKIAAPGAARAAAPLEPAGRAAEGARGRVAPAAKPQTVLERMAAATTGARRPGWWRRRRRRRARDRDAADLGGRRGSGGRRAGANGGDQAHRRRLGYGARGSRKVRPPCRNRDATLAEATAQISGSVHAIERSAERQIASVKVIAELELRTRDIAEITQTVGRISDQTNLLALNGDRGRARAGRARPRLRRRRGRGARAGRDIG